MFQILVHHGFFVVFEAGRRKNSDFSPFGRTVQQRAFLHPFQGGCSANICETAHHGAELTETPDGVHPQSPQKPHPLKISVKLQLPNLPHQKR